MTPLFIVTLYPFDDDERFDFRFDTKEDAEGFADLVRELPDAEVVNLTLGRPIVVWEATTFSSPANAAVTLHSILKEYQT